MKYDAHVLTMSRLLHLRIIMSVVLPEYYRRLTHVCVCVCVCVRARATSYNETFQRIPSSGSPPRSEVLPCRRYR